MQNGEVPDSLARVRRLWRRVRQMPPSFYTVSLAPGRHKLFKWFFTGCVSIAIVSTCIESGLHPLMLLLLPAIAAGLLRRDYGREFFLSEKSGFVFFIVYMALLGLGALLFRSVFTLPISMVYFTFGVLVIRVMGPLTDRNVEQLILLTFGMILINCIITNHLAFGIMLPFYLFALMGTLMLFHVARTPAPAEECFDPADTKNFRNGVLKTLTKSAILIVVFAVLFFVLIPRPFVTIPGLRFGAPASGLGAMSQRITYREMVGMGDLQRIAFMVRLEAGSFPRFPYWRGRVLEKNDGRGWVYAGESRSVTKPVPIDYSKALVYQFIPYKLQTETIYAYGFPVGAHGKMDRPLYINPSGEIIVDSPFLFADSYRVTALDRPFPMSRRSADLNLDLTGLTPKITALARDWGEGLTSPDAKARRIVSRLTNYCKYVLQPTAPPADTNPMEYFLFDSREGNCEYFAGALCLMLRAEGIPARVVEGFAGMDPSSIADEYIVRFSHAHAWVEAALDKEYWTVLDATPPTRLDAAGDFVARFLTDVYDTIQKKWTKYVVYFDRSDQARFFEGLSEIMNVGLELPAVSAANRVHLVAAFFGGALLLAACLVFVALRRRPRSPESVYTLAMLDLIKMGVLDSMHQWHELNTKNILNSVPQAKDSVRRFMKLYFDSRFGTNGISVQKLNQAREELVRAAKDSVSSR